MSAAIHAGVVVISGTVHGNITAERKVDIHAERAALREHQHAVARDRGGRRLRGRLHDGPRRREGRIGRRRARVRPGTAARAVAGGHTAWHPGENLLDKKRRDCGRILTFSRSGRQQRERGRMLDINWTFLVQLGFFLAFMADRQPVPLPSRCAPTWRAGSGPSTTSRPRRAAPSPPSPSSPRSTPARSPPPATRTSPAAPTSASRRSPSSGRSSTRPSARRSSPSTPRRTSWRRKSPPPARTCSSETAGARRRDLRQGPREGRLMRRLLRAAAALAPRPRPARRPPRSPPRAAGTRRCRWTTILWEMGIKVLDVGDHRLLRVQVPLQADRAGHGRPQRGGARGARGGHGRPARSRGPPRRVPGEGRRPRRRRSRRCAARPPPTWSASAPSCIEEGRAAAEHVAQHARETIRQEVAKARAELHREAALLAVQVATANVKAQITAADQQRILDEYAASLESAR